MASYLLMNIKFYFIAYTKKKHVSVEFLIYFKLCFYFGHSVRSY